MRSVGEVSEKLQTIVMLNLTHLYPVSLSTLKYQETKNFPLSANGSLQWGNTEQFLHWNWIKEVTVDRFMPTECKNHTQLEQSNKSTVS